MLIRTQVTSVLPRSRRVSLAIPSLRAMATRAADAQRLAVRMQGRADAARAHAVARHGYGRVR